MTATLRKWRAVYSICLQETIAYRASMAIWVLTDLTTAVVMPLVWAAAANNGTIQGMATGDFVLYYLAMLQVGSFVTSHIMWDLAGEIREGIFSIYLVRPISVYQYTLLRNLSWRTIRPLVALPFFLTLFILYRPLMGEVRVYLGWEFWVAVVLGHFVSFCFVMAMAMIALFIQEAFAVFELYYVPQLFLSGYLFPVALLPDWAKSIAHVFPFYYTTGAPVEILIGKVSGFDCYRVMGIQVLWIAISYVLGWVLWVRGLRHYTGVGM